MVETERSINVPLLVMGAIASSFVGTLYGYSYLKDNISDFWQHEQVSDHDKKVMAEWVDKGYYAGFFGQYLALFPGLIFDQFGAAVTCWYGAFLCCLGFVSVAYGAKNVVPAALVVGICLAGQGSKGLGFGTLLGTVKALPDSWSTAISGTYLMFDALSSVFAMLVFDYVPFFATKGWMSATAKAEQIFRFFLSLGVTIGVVGALAGFVYLVFGPRTSTEVQATPVDPEDIDDEDENNVRRASRAGSEQQRRSSLADEAALIAMAKLKENTKKKGDEEAPLIENENPSPEKKTFWAGAICCFTIMFLGESQGLTFNNSIGDAFLGSRKSKVGMVSWNDYRNYDFHTLLDDFHVPTEDEPLEHEKYDIFRKVVMATFNHLPRYMTVLDDGKTIEFCSGQESIMVEGLELKPRKFTLKKPLSDDVVLLEDANGNKKYKKDFSADKDEEDRDLFQMMNIDGYSAQNEVAEIMKHLAPVSGFQVDGKDIHFVSYITNDKELFDTVTFNDKGELMDQYKLLTLENFIEADHAESLRTQMHEDARDLDVDALKSFPRVLRPDAGSAQMASLQMGVRDKKLASAAIAKAKNAEPKSQAKTEVNAEDASTEVNAEEEEVNAEAKPTLHQFYYPQPSKENKSFADYPFRRWIVGLTKEVPAPGSDELELAPRFAEISDTELRTIQVEKRDDLLYYDIRRMSKGIVAGDTTGLIQNSAIPKDSKDKRLHIKIKEYKADKKMWEVVQISTSIGTDSHRKDGEPFLAKAEDIWPLDGSHKSEMKGVKRNLTITFALGNAFGRLSFGFAAPPLERKTSFLPCAFWFIFGSIIYGIFFLYIGLSGIPCTLYSDANEPIPGNNMLLNVVTGVIAVIYGGIFTINTAYMKEIVAPNLLGLVLGGSLVVLSVGSYIFGTYIAKGWAVSDIDFAEDVGCELRKNFFLSAAAMQVFALIPASFCWWSGVLESRAKKAEALAAAEGIEDDDTEKEDDAEEEW